MKVLHVMASSNIADGGSVQVVLQITPALARKGVQVAVFAPGAGPGEEHSSVHPGVRIALFPQGRFSKHWLGWSWPLARSLFKEVEGFDLVHTHGLWYFPQLVACMAAKAAGVPFMVTVNGELSPVQLRNRALRKQIYSAIIQKRLLAGAAALHAASDGEVGDIRDFVDHPNLVVIPHGVDPVELEPPEDSTRAEPISGRIRGKKIVLFLGRVQEGKGMDILARAIGLLCRTRDDVRLLIAGPDHWGYGDKVKKILENEGNLDKAVFAGMLRGDAKKRALHSEDVFVLPSLSEAFSIAVLEAMGAGLPAIISRGCHFPEAVEKGCALEIDLDPVHCASAIAELLDNPLRARAMGERAKALIMQRYLWDSIAGLMKGVYEKVASSGRTVS